MLLILTGEIDCYRPSSKASTLKTKRKSSLYKPAAKAFSLPVKIMQPISGFFSISFNASSKSSNKALHRAFKAFGRFKRINPTLFFSPVVSTKMLSYDFPKINRNYKKK